jgi:hypothetical protein
VIPAVLDGVIGEALLRAASGDPAGALTLTMHVREHRAANQVAPQQLAAARAGAQTQTLDTLVAEVQGAGAPAGQA